MKNRKFLLCTLAVFLVLTTLSISVAAEGVRQTPEIQGITSTVYIDVVGSASNVVELAWTSGSGSLQDNPPLSTGESVQTTVYTEDTHAMNGHTVYVKEFGVNTGNQLMSQNNVKSIRQITFEGDTGGNIVSDESILIDTVGMPSSAGDQFLCPFGSAGTGTLPAYCNIVQAGSHVDSSFISFSTQASSRSVMASADVPVGLAYSINAHGVNTANGIIPGQGLASAFMKIHLMGGSGANLTKASDLTYADTSTINGIITTFTKELGYQSGARLV